MRGVRWGAKRSGSPRRCCPSAKTSMMSMLCSRDSSKRRELLCCVRWPAVVSNQSVGTGQEILVAANACRGVAKRQPASGPTSRRRIRTRRGGGRAGHSTGAARRREDGTGSWRAAGQRASKAGTGRCTGSHACARAPGDGSTRRPDVCAPWRCRCQAGRRCLTAAIRYGTAAPGAAGAHWELQD